MPTGYTMDVPKGQSFSSFVWGCAKAFGACVTMRDEPSNAKVPAKFEPSDYHTKKLVEIERDMRLLSKTSDAFLQKELEKEIAKIQETNQQYRDDAALELKRYNAMLAKVEDWTPPSKDHEGLKEFMRQQLAVSLPDPEYIYQQEVPPLDVKLYRERRAIKLKQDHKYHSDKHAEEVARVAQRNAWVEGLRASVPQP